MPFKLHSNTNAIEFAAVLYQEQDGKDRVKGYASKALSKSESHYPAYKLEFLACHRNIQEYLYSNTFTSYPDNNPLTYVLTTTKQDAMGHRWIAKLAIFNFTVITDQENLT